MAMNERYEINFIDDTGGSDSGGRNWLLWAKALMLVGFGAYFSLIILTGSLPNYINQRFSWLTYIAAALFLLFGLVALSDARKGLHRRSEHLTLSWGVIAIVAIPLVLGTLIPSQPLGVDAISGSIATNAGSLGANAAAFSRDPLDRNILDWLREFNNGAPMASHNGLPVDLVGFVYREPTFPENQFMIARFTISCCVADATALGIPVQIENAMDFADGQWIHITGVLEAGEFDGATLPIIRADEITPVEQPDHPYLYS